MSSPLVIGALRDPSSARTPFSRPLVAIEPRGADPALDLPSLMAELRLVKRLTAKLADDDRGDGISCRNAGHLAGVDALGGATREGDSLSIRSLYNVRVPRGYHGLAGTTSGTK